MKIIYLILTLFLSVLFMSPINAFTFSSGKAEFKSIDYLKINSLEVEKGLAFKLTGQQHETELIKQENINIVHSIANKLTNSVFIYEGVFKSAPLKYEYG